jgi:hypothetical protein
MLRFNYFADAGAFTRDATGRYRVDFDKMRAAMNSLSAKLLTVQGDGDYAEAKRMTDTLGVVKPELAADLARLKDAKIPVDIRFEQGLDVLGWPSTPRLPPSDMSGYCDFAPGHALHGPYHDTEYGFPSRDEAVLFERLVLEINQAGLSWETMLKKRDGFRRAYHGFDVDKVAAMVSAIAHACWPTPASSATGSRWTPRSTMHR